MSLRFVDLFGTVDIDNQRFVDIFTKSFTINSSYKADASFYKKFQLVPGERLDEIAFNLYGNENLWWLVAMYANIMDPIEAGYMTQEEILETADKIVAEFDLKYPGSSDAEKDAIKNEFIDYWTAYNEDNINSINAIDPNYISNILINIKRTIDK